MAQAKDESAQTPEEAPDEIVVEEAETTEAAVATATLTDEKAESPLAGERVIYVPSPERPKVRSNRLVGALLALVGTVVFAVVYALVGAAFIQLTASKFGFGDFITDAIFWVPVLFFTVGFVLVVVLINRAPWWVHVAGSLLVAVIAYFGSIGMLLLVNAIAGRSVGFISTALSPYVIAATIVAREVSIWVGLLIARRGVRLTARNRAEREAFEAEQAGKSDGTSPAA